MSVISAETGKLLALSMLKGVGPATLRMALNVANFASASIEEIGKQVPRLTAVCQQVFWLEALEKAERSRSGGASWSAQSFLCSIQIIP
ncbi:hypothetical protein CLOSS21_00003, partial [Clostridium sp. SS2/1]